MNIKQPTKKQLEKVLKNTLFSVPEKKVKYENKKPTKEQLKQKFKLEKHG